MPVLKYQPEGSDADLQLAETGPSVSNKEAQLLRLELKSNPDDLTSRLILFGRGFFGNSNSSVIHLPWLIDNHPRLLIHNHPGLTSRKSDETYKRARIAWLRQIRLNPNDVTILVHAAHFLSFQAGEDAVKFLHRASELDSFNDDIPRELSFLYQLMAGHFSPRKNKILAHKAVEQLKVAIDRYAIPTEDDSYLLPYFSMVVIGVADTALRFGLLQDANDLAQILLSHQSINAARSSVLSGANWRYKLSTYRGHSILGIAAARSGNVDQAKEHLSIMMDLCIIRDADFLLASELLELGESEIVIKYLQHCSEGWQRELEEGYSDRKYAEGQKAWLIRWIKEIECGAGKLADRRVRPGIGGAGLWEVWD